jgi:hypothetical protein
VLAVVLSWTGVSPALATQPNNAWGTNNVVGLCAQRNGGYVLAAQNILYAGFGYSPMDAVWGTNSDTATKAFQRQVGLLRDGCVGPQTWGAMRGFVVSLCTPGFVCNSPNRAARINGGVVFYDRTNCDWGTYIAGNQAVGGSVRRGVTYSFSTALTPEVFCA